MTISKQWLQVLEDQASTLIREVNQNIDNANPNFIDEENAYKHAQRELRNLKVLVENDLENIPSIDPETYPNLFDIFNSITIRNINSLRVENNKNYH